MTDAQVTQVSLEQWGASSPTGQVTQVAVEMWATTSTVTVQALVTQVAVEMWASTATRRPRRMQNVARR